MESRWRSLFSRNKSKGKSREQTNGNNNKNPSNSVSTKSRFSSKSYDSAVALNPPIKGSYPVAGNGPTKVLDKIQQNAIMRRQSESTVGHAEPPNIPRWREEVVDRPRTAPHSGGPSGHLPTKDEYSNPLSRFGAKLPRTRTASVQHQQRPSIETPRRNTSLSISGGFRYIHAYQPKRKPDGGYVPSYIPTQYPQIFLHARDRSTASSTRASYVDILDAHGALVNSKDSLQNRVLASGIRGYGEDVADRNIAENGSVIDGYGVESSQNDYRRKMYTNLRSSNGSNNDGIRDRVALFEHALDDVYGAGDDTPPRSNTPPLFSSPLSPRPAQTRQTTQTMQTQKQIHQSAALKSLTADSPRIDSAASYQNARAGRDDVRGIRRSRTIPSSAAAAAIAEDFEPPSPDRHRHSFQQPRTYTPAIPERAKARLSRDTESISDSHNNQNNSDISTKPVSFSRGQTISSDSPKQNHLSVASPIANESRTRPRATSATSADAPVRTRSKTGSDIYSTKRSSLHLPEAKDISESMPARSSPVSLKKRFSADSRYSVEVKDRTSPLKKPRPQSMHSYPLPSLNPYWKPVSPSNQGTLTLNSPNNVGSTNRRSSLVEEATEAPSLDGIVDVTNTVDTEVITKQLPPVTYEFLTPTVHNIPEEAVTCEIYTHDVFHRILPVIEIGVLPTEHYVQAADGKSLVEIPADQVPGRTKNPSVQIVPSARREKRNSYPNGAAMHIGNLASRDPILLSSLRKSITKDGALKTESVWRHPPTLETGGTAGQTVSKIFDDSASVYSEDDVYYDVRYEIKSTHYGKSEEDLLFRDSGYGSGGMLPGLNKSARRPMTIGKDAHVSFAKDQHLEDSESRERYGENLRPGESQAASALRRRHEAKERLRRAYEEEGIKGVVNNLKVLSGHK